MRAGGATALPVIRTAFSAATVMRPQPLRKEAKQQLPTYPSVRWIAGEATHATPNAESFDVLVNEQTLSASRLVLASGVVDQLPEVEGLSERWGRSVFHCPYCHGYELNQGVIGVLATSELAMHHAQLLPEWGTVTLLLNGASTPDDAQKQLLERCGVQVESSPVLRLVDHGNAVL